MGNLEEQLNKQDAVIRHYLLDQVDEETALEIDEKIFLEPNFYDYVLLIEQEIIEDLVAGNLSDEDRARATQIYGIPANRGKREFEVALRKAAAAANNERREPSSRTTDIAAVEKTLLENVRKRFGWRYFIPAFCALVVILLTVTWLLLPDKRGAIEKELTLLNHENTAQPGINIQRISLESDSVRSGVGASTMPKVRISGNDQIIGFRLGLVGPTQESYEATFIDEHGSEMFSVAALKIQSDENGKYVLVMVPLRLFAPSDFQIHLQGRDETGALTKAGSFTFRVSRS